MKKLRFFLMKDFDNSIYYYWDGNLQQFMSTTIASTTGTSIADMPSPINWSDTQMKWDRDATMLGLFSSLATNFQFSGVAASILSNLSIQYGVQATCFLRIQVLSTDTTGAYFYQDLYVANIDFSTIDTGYLTDGSGTVTIGTIYNQLTELLKAYGDTTYNVPMWWLDAATNTQKLDPDAIPVYTDGIKITAAYNFISASGDGGQQTVSGSIGTVPSITSSWLLPSLSNIEPATPYFGNEIIANNVLVGTQISDGGTGYTQVWQKNNYILRVLQYNPGTTISAWLTGAVLITTPSGWVGVFTAAILGVSFDPSSGTNTVRSINIIYQKTLNTSGDSYLFFEDPTAGTGTTIPTVKSGPNFPTSITLTSGGASSDGIQYVLGFNMSSGASGVGWSIQFGQYSGTTFIPTPINFVSNGPVRYPASGTLGFRFKDVWKKIVPVMAATQGNEGFPVAPVGASFQGVSNFLNNPSILPSANYDNVPYNTVLTSGNALRLFNYFNFLELTVNNVIQCMMRLWQMGVGIEGNNLRAEPLSYWFDGSTMIADLSNIPIANFKWTPFTNFMGNQVKVGYNSQAFNEVGALDDWNLSQLFRLPITRILNKIDWTNPFNASVYQIEKARANQQANSTINDPTDTLLTDAEQDNENYLLEIDTTTTNSPTVNSPTAIPCYNLKRYSWTTTSGAPLVAPSVNGLNYPDTAYNLGLTGKKTLLRNGNFLASICHPQNSASILFQKADHTGRLKTDKLESNISAGRITEYADVAVSSLPTPLFLPIMFSFDSPQPANLFQIMSTNPKGYIKFKWQGNIYKGFIWEAGINPGSNMLFSFKLLATPDTDVSKLQLA